MGGGPHLALVGPTACGKSALALRAAVTHGDLEIVSMDSMQVYRGMDVGTATPTVEDRRLAPHHLLDLVDPTEEHSVAAHQAAAREVLAGIEARGHRALLVGGTALYLRAVVDDLDIPGRYPGIRRELGRCSTAELQARLEEADPAAAARIEPDNRRRLLRAVEVTVGSGRPFSSYGPGLDAHPPTPFRLIGVWLPRAVTAARIEARYRRQVAGGFLDEVDALAALGDDLSRTAAEALGYRELLAHRRGESALDEAVDEAVRRTRQFARRQRMWFRRDPRIRWLAHAGDPGALAPAFVGATAPDG